MNRRDIIKTGAATIAIAGAPGLAAIADAQAAAAPMPGTPEDARLTAVFDRIVSEMLDRSPEGATSLGLDSGARAGEKARLDDRSIAAWEDDKRRTHRQRAELMAIDRSKLSGLGPSNYDSVLFGIAVADDLNGLPFIGNPYAVSQLTGAYQQIPDFLDSQHSIANSADAEAYLSRLAAFATALSQESEQVRHDVAIGVVPPDFIIAKTLIQMKALRDTPPATANLVQSLVRRTKDKGLPGDWEAPRDQDLTPAWSSRR